MKKSPILCLRMKSFLFLVNIHYIVKNYMPNFVYDCIHTIIKKSAKAKPQYNINFATYKGNYFIDKKENNKFVLRAKL